MPVWLQILLAVGSPVLTIIGTAFIFGARTATMQAAINANADAIRTLSDATTKAIEALSAGKVSIDQGRGLQAQIKRLETADATCDGKIGAVREELHDRVERQSTKIARIEEAHAGQMTSLTGSMGKMEATMQAMKESVDRLRDEQARHTAPPASDPFAHIEGLVRLQKLMREAAH